MKKKSIMARVGVLALALTLVTSSLTSGTLARYTDSQDIFAKAIVAKWAFKKDSTYAEKGATIGAPFELSAQNNNSAVASARVAPGTSGKIPITIDLTGSEVDILMTAKIAMCTNEGLTADDDGFDNTGYEIPAGLKFYLASDIKYATDNNKPLNEITIGKDGVFVDLLKTNSDPGKIFRYSPTGAETKWTDEIVWKWDYLAANDEDDTKVGKKNNLATNPDAGTEKQYALTYKIKINAVQTNSAGTVADEVIPVA